mgnify:CR=1 FL=1
MNEKVKELVDQIMSLAEDSQEETPILFDLDELAVKAGIPAKPLYSLGELADMTGISRTTIYAEAREGHLKTFMPVGKQRGQLVRKEWFDDWFLAGTR